LKTLNEGKGIADGQYIIKGLPLDGVAENVVDLHRNTYRLMKGLFVFLGEIFKQNWTVEGIDVKRFKELLQLSFSEIKTKILNIDLTEAGFTNPTEEKNRVIKAVQDYLDSLPKKMEAIKKQ